MRVCFLVNLSSRRAVRPTFNSVLDFYWKQQQHKTMSQFLFLLIEGQQDQIPLYWIVAGGKAQGRGKKRTRDIWFFFSISYLWLEQVAYFDFHKQTPLKNEKWKETWMNREKRKPRRKKVTDNARNRVKSLKRNRPYFWKLKLCLMSSLCLAIQLKLTAITRNWLLVQKILAANIIVIKYETHLVSVVKLLKENVISILE